MKLFGHKRGGAHGAPKKRRLPQPYRGLLIGLCAAVAVILSLAAALFSQIRPPDGAGPSPSRKPGATAPPHKADVFLRRGMQYEVAVYSEGEPPDLVEEDRRDGVYTLAILASDDGGLLTDAMMIATFDTEQNRVGIISIPRDTLTNVSRYTKKVNAAFGLGGLTQLKKELRSLLGYSPEHYVLVDLDGVVALVDAIGGVDFHVPMDMNYDDPSQNLHIHFKEGLQPIDGQAAMELLRYRQDNPDANGHIRGYDKGDIRRIEVQQEFLMAVMKKVIATVSPARISEYVELYANYVRTDLTVGNLVWFGLEAYGAAEADQIAMATLPTESQRYRGASGNIDYEVVLSSSAIALINETTNPRTRDITRSDVSHISVSSLQTAPPSATNPPPVSSTPPPETEPPSSEPPDATDPPPATLAPSPTLPPPPTPTPLGIPDPVRPSNPSGEDEVPMM